MRTDRRDESDSGWGLGEWVFTLAAICALVCLGLGMTRPGLTWKPAFNACWITLLGLFMLGGALLRNEFFQEIFVAIDPMKHWLWGRPSDGDRAGPPAVRMLYLVSGTIAVVMGCLLAMGMF